MRGVFRVVIILLVVCTFLQPSYSQKQKPLRHFVSIKVRIVPLFVIDKDGEPVYDLKKEELELFIDGKKVPLEHLLKRDISSEKEEIKRFEKVRESVKQAQERIVFIIMDAMFNDRFGARRMKKLVGSIIKSGSKFDKFVVFSIAPRRGLFYIAGPDHANPSLIKRVKKVRLGSRFRPSGSSMTSQRTPAIKHYNTFFYRDVLSGHERLVHEFTKYLVQLKYAMNTFVQPKVVYLISQGFGIKMETSWYLKDIVKTMNQGGAALFTINPGRVQSFASPESGKASLMNMAEDSGGKFFQGEKITQITRNIKKTTNAYYEAVFSVDENKKKSDFKIEILCKRKDIRILMPKTLAKTKTYKDLSDFEKQLYVVNVVGGGLWSNSTGLVKKAEFKVNKREGETSKYKIAVKIPEILKNKFCDIYIVNLIRENNDARIQNYSKVLSRGFDSISIERMDGEELYFVIIDRVTGNTIFGKVGTERLIFRR